jgi:preprotein translocase subunit SecY
VTEELARRIAITVGALLLYRLGTYVPLPGVDPTIWDQIFRAEAGGILGSLNLMAGGGIHRMAIFALNVMPYLTAAIFLQLVMMVSRRLRALARTGEDGRASIERSTRTLAVVLSALQSLGIAFGLEGVPGLVAYPGWLFVTSTVITLTGGTLFLVWLSSQITLRGIGNGIALLLATGIVTQLPATVAGALELGRMGMVSGNALVAVAATVIVATAFVVVIELARRRIPVEYAARPGPSPARAGRSDLSLKLNPAGVIPVFLTSFFLGAPAAVGTFIGLGGSSSLGLSRPLYLILYAALIILFAFLYTAFVLDPEDAAENLRKRGGTIPGIEPGEPTAAYLDETVSRSATIGAIYLALICLLPEFLISTSAVPFYFGGTSLLLVVCTCLDLVAQVQGYAGRPRA